MIAAFIAQKMSADESLLAAVYLHGAAGDELAKQDVTLGMTARTRCDRMGKMAVKPIHLNQGHYEHPLSYLIVVIACIALLIGHADPQLRRPVWKNAWMRILREVTVNLQPFQEIANKYLAGDLAKLVELNARVTRNHCRKKAAAIEAMMLRASCIFEADMAAMPDQPAG